MRMSNRMYLFPSIFGLLVLSFFVSAQNRQFADHFQNATLRIDYYLTGDANQTTLSIDQLYRQGVWSGNPEQLISSFNNGKYLLKLFDETGNTLIYSQGYSTIFPEYRSTDPAQAGIPHTFHQTVRTPFPLHPVRLVIEERDHQNHLQPLFVMQIDPQSIDIRKEPPGQADDRIIRYLENGPSGQCVDLAFLAEGYSAKEFPKFQADLQRFAEALFSISPYRELKERFNIYGIFRASRESGVDQPRRGIFKNTAFSASFNALNSARYLLTEANRPVQDAAGQVPWDALVILVNSSRYGGGGIYNFYCITTVDHPFSVNVFVHEFGHSFAGLGDEYYTASVAYNEFFPAGIEPLEPNLTALLNPSRVKWDSLLTPGIAIPTDWGKAEYEHFQKKRSNLIRERDEKLALLEQNSASQELQNQLRVRYQSQINSLDRKIKQVLTQNPHQDHVGAFEGAAYTAKGFYRPMVNCLMFSNQEQRFCRVCQEAIKQTIAFYSNGSRNHATD